MSNSWFKKEKPLMGLLGTGGGAAQGGAAAPIPVTMVYMMMGGGGGGGGGQGGGGGGGAAGRFVADASPYVLTLEPYPINLGAKGSGGAGGPITAGGDGGTSYFTAPTVSAFGGGGGGANNVPSSPVWTGRDGTGLGACGGGGGSDGSSSPDNTNIGPGGAGVAFPGQPEINLSAETGSTVARNGGEGYSGPGTYNGNRGGGGGGIGGNADPADYGPTVPAGRDGGKGGNGLTVPTTYLPDAWTMAGPTNSQPNYHYTSPNPATNRDWNPSQTNNYFQGVDVTAPGGNSTRLRNFGGGGGGGSEKQVGGWGHYGSGPGEWFRGGCGAGGADPTNAPNGGTWGFAGGGGSGGGPQASNTGSTGGGGIIIFKVPTGFTATSPLITDPTSQIFDVGSDRIIYLQNNTTSDVNSTITFEEA